MNPSTFRRGRGRYTLPIRSIPPTLHGRYRQGRQPRQIGPALGHLIATITSGELIIDKKDDKIGITDCRYIASYNLMEGLDKTIFVPGKPPAWTPLRGSITLQEDAGEYYRDVNAARFPTYPLEPAVKSVFMMNEQFDTSKIDIFACGSTLGDILRFASEKRQPFTFIAQKIGTTVFFVRRELSPTVRIENIHGYGHAFPEANTTWRKDVKGSGLHQRIVEYDFGGFTFLVRYEADGHVIDVVEGDLEESKVDTAVEELFANMLGSLKSKSATVEAASEQSLTIEWKGSRISQDSLFDLKTRSERKKREDIMADELPRLWVRQVSKLLLAFHKSGTFDVPDILDVSGEVAEWEVKSCDVLRRMVALVERIRDAAMKVEGGKLEVRGDGSDGLQLRELSVEDGVDWNALPGDVEEEWKRMAGDVSQGKFRNGKNRHTHRYARQLLKNLLFKHPRFEVHPKRCNRPRRASLRPAKLLNSLGFVPLNRSMMFKTLSRQNS